MRHAISPRLATSRVSKAKVEGTDASVYVFVDMAVYAMDQQ